MEEDEAGRLRSFRARFGRGFDAEALKEGEEAREGEEKLDESQSGDSLLDLISGFGKEAEGQGKVAGKREEAVKSEKGKGGQK